MHFTKETDGGITMEATLLSRVKNTRIALREQQIAMIFDEFDEQCMQLTDEQRVEKYKKIAVFIEKPPF